MLLIRLLFAALALFAVLPALAAEDDFLDPEKAFRIGARVLDERSLEVRFDIAPGYYMYREQFRFSAEGGAQLGEVQLPAGKVKFDETFAKDVETYREVLTVRVPVQQAAGPFRMTVVSQGCADRGLCYPPMASSLDVRLAAFGGDGSAKVLSSGDLPPPSDAQGAAQSAGPAATPAAAAMAINTASPNDGARLDAALRAGGFWVVVGVFFLAGVLLSFTPCVLPMLPILSSIIVGDGATASRGRALALAASYSLGMAVVYTAFGIAAGLAGEGLAAWLQTPWVLALFAAALVALSLSMFGLYELRLPGAGTLAARSQRLQGGRLASVFAMGGVSALIVSPCVAAPLAGALVYLSQTRDVALGGTALFALAAGMSVPLLAAGASAGALLPRAGAWMEEVKRLFGLLLLAVAIWIVQPVLPASLALALWGALLLGTGAWLGVLTTTLPVWRRALGLVVAFAGAMQLVGAASGGTDPLQPLAHLAARGGGAAAHDALVFQPVRSVAELDAALAAAKRPVMLDFYADWCVSCKEMERFTFSDATVRARLDGALLLKADVTQNTADDRALMRRFGLFGPPGTLFFDASGRELTQARVIGFQDAERFAQTLGVAGL
jgi:thiol:disulfide interchange protein DsbD